MRIYRAKPTSNLEIYNLNTCKTHVNIVPDVYLYTRIVHKFMLNIISAKPEYIIGGGRDYLVNEKGGNSAWQRGVFNPKFTIKVQKCCHVTDFLNILLLE